MLIIWHGGAGSWRQVAWEQIEGCCSWNYATLTPKAQTCQLLCYAPSWLKILMMSDHTIFYSSPSAPFSCRFLLLRPLDLFCLLPHAFLILFSTSFSPSSEILSFPHTFQVLHTPQSFSSQKRVVQHSHISGISLCWRQRIILGSKDSKIGVYSWVSASDSILSFTQTVEEFMSISVILHYWNHPQRPKLS